MFEGLNIWKDEKCRQLQGTYPVISLSFANVKGRAYKERIAKMNGIFSELYIKNEFLKKSGFLAEAEMEYFGRIMWSGIRAVDTTDSLHRLCDFMQRYYGRKAIVLLDEYDTPMQEAYVRGYWDDG